MKEKHSFIIGVTSNIHLPNIATFYQHLSTNDSGHPSLWSVLVRMAGESIYLFYPKFLIILVLFAVCVFSLFERTKMQSVVFSMVMVTIGL